METATNNDSIPVPIPAAVEKLLHVRAWCTDRLTQPGTQSETSFPVHFESPGFTSLSVRSPEKKTVGYGKKYKARIKRDRIARLKDSRAKAQATKSRQRFYRVVGDDGLIDRRNRKIGATVQNGGSYNYGTESLQLSIAEYRKPDNFRTKKNAYLLNGKTRTARSNAMRDWNELHSLFLASIKKPATGYLPAPAPRRNESEEYFEQFVHSQLLPLSIEYPELDTPHDCNDLFVGWNGHYNVGVRDFDLEIEDLKLQVQVKGIGSLYYRAKDLIKEHWDDARLKRFRRLRTDVFNLLLRVHQSRIFAKYADSEIRPMLVVSATSARAWRKQDQTVKNEKALLDLLETESDRSLTYLLGFAEAVFSAEYKVFEETVNVIDEFLSGIEDHVKIDLVDLLEVYRAALENSKRELNYRDSFLADLHRFRSRNWSDIYPLLPDRFTATKSSFEK